MSLSNLIRVIVAAGFLAATSQHPVFAQAGGPIVPGAPCTAFGTTSGTCIQGAGAGGTPSSINLTNGTSLPVSTGISGLGTGVATALGSAVSGSGSICLSSGSACAAGAANRAVLGLTTRTGITSTTGVMLGYGSTLALTPNSSGRVRFQIAAYATSSSAQTNTYLVYYGTGAAPANGAAVTGTNPSGGNVNISHAASAAANASFSFEVSGLTLSTAYWFDIGVATGSGGSTDYSARQIVVQEIP